MPGHFEVYRDHPDDSASGFAWRFVAEEGHELACSSENYEDRAIAKSAVVDFVQRMRQATYGQRFAAAISDAISDVDV